MKCSHVADTNELIEKMRLHTPWFRAGVCTGACERRHNNCVIPLAADLLEAAIEDIPHSCVTCRYEYNTATCQHRKTCADGSLWEWRGLHV